MNIVGFFFTKVHASKSNLFKKGLTKTFNIDLTNVEKEEAPFSTKNSLVKTSFKYEVLYTDNSAKKDNVLGEISLEGTITIMMNDEESKEFMKTWKGKKIPANLQEGLVNFILRKCSPKALELEDSVNLPFHLPIPRAKFNAKAE